MNAIRLHGLPLVQLSDGRTLSLSAREAALLAWLHLEGPTPRGLIAGRLWPGGDESKARANLRQLLLRLKRAGGHLLDEDDGVLSLASTSQVAAPEGRLLGPLEFDDAPDLADWLNARRDADQRTRLREGLQRARTCLEAGDFDQALAHADALLADDPAVEEAHRLRMEAFYLRGDRAAAITAWDACRDALRTAYGITPSAATNDLGRLVLAAEAAGLKQTQANQARQGAVAAVLPAALKRPPVLVGRDGELETIARAFAMGHGVVVAGPGGIGKSRLLAQAAAAMEPAVVVGGRPGDVHLPGVVASRLVAAAIDRFAPDLDAVTRADIALLLPGGPSRSQALQSALEHRRVLASVARTMLACHAKGMRLVVVDDIQFADDLSMEAIAVVIGGWLSQPPDSAALPLFGCRADELRPPASALVRMLEGSNRCVRIDLGPLSVNDLRSLLEGLPLDPPEGAASDRPAMAQALHAQVGGNPAFVLESVRSLWLDGLSGWQAGQALAVPANLKESLRQRLARLDNDALQLAQLAAVAQEDFSLSLASAAMGRPPLALSPLFATLEAAQVLDGVRFSHDLVAEAARASLPSTLVVPLHQLVADHLRGQGAAPARIAWHLQQAGAHIAAIPWLLEAAQAARDRWQLSEAARCYQAAALAMEQRDQAEGLTVQAPHIPRDSTATTWLNAARWWTAVSEYATALDALDRGLVVAVAPSERLELRASRVVVRFNAQQTSQAASEALALAQDIEDHPDVLAVERLAAILFPCVAVIQHVPDPDRLARVAESLRERCAQGSDRARQSYFLSMGTCLNWLGQPVKAAADLRQSRELAERLGDHGPVVNVTNQQLRSAMLQGQFEAAMEAALACQRAVQAGGYGSSFRLHGLAAEALIRVASGRVSDAFPLLLELRSLLVDVDPRKEPEVASALAMGWIAFGRDDWAREAMPPQEAWSSAPWFGLVRWQLASTEHERTSALRDLEVHWPGDDTTMGWRRRLLAARHASPSLADAEAWVATLTGRGLLPLARQAHLIAARAAASAQVTELARHHVQHALALAYCVDPWTDQIERVWEEGASALASIGDSLASGELQRQGADWRRGVAQTLLNAPAAGQAFKSVDVRSQE